MPYVTEHTRTNLQLGFVHPHTAGELNYKLTLQLLNYIEYNNLSYQTINDVIGALEGAKLEFYRRVAVPYENRKIKENGDVYPAE